MLESVNGVNLSNVDHCDAVCAISEHKGVLNLVRIRHHSCRNQNYITLVIIGGTAMQESHCISAYSKWSCCDPN